MNATRAMKELIYIQAGQFANFIGTHFWNTQEAYFTYGDDEQSEVDHDVSFREGSTLIVRACPFHRRILY